MEILTMNKRKLIVAIGITFVCLFAAILSFVLQKQKKVDQAVKMYQEFIEGERTASGWDIMEFSSSKEDSEWPLDIDMTYAMVDVTGDGIPELHIYGARCEYVIFSVKDGEMYQLGYFQCYMREYTLLENGAFLFKEDDRFDYGVHYEYFELDASGKPVNEVYFSWVSRDTDYWTYQEKDRYEFDGQICTYEEWYALTRKYLRTTVTGDEEVRNAVEWTRYCTFKK